MVYNLRGMDPDSSSLAKSVVIGCANGDHIFYMDWWKGIGNYETTSRFKEHTTISFSVIDNSQYS